MVSTLGNKIRTFVKTLGQNSNNSLIEEFSVEDPKIHPSENKKGKKVALGDLPLD